MLDIETKNETPNSDLEISRAVRLSTIEIVAGSIGHGFKIPLTGFFLSLNQLYFLANALNKDKLSRSSTFEISGIAAALKSLSIAGQKVGPMFSIMAQGSLFYLGTLVAGTGLVGQLIGATLMTLWSFIQSLLTYIVVFGLDYTGMLSYLNEKLVLKNFALGHYLLATIAIAVLFKILMGLTLVLLSYFKKEEITFVSVEKINILKTHLKVKPNLLPQNNLKAAAKDLLKPFFILNLAIMIFFYSRMEKSVDLIAWYAVRSLAIAYLLFFCVRNTYVQQMLKKRFSGFYLKAQRVSDLMNNDQNT